MLQPAKLSEKMKAVPQELLRIFDFYLPGMVPPNRVVFGFGAIDHIGEEATNLAKGKTALVISDKTLEGINTLDYVVSLLSSSGFSVEIFTDIEPEPHIETADALYDKCAGKDFSVVVGLGGGSVMDMSKLTAQSLRSGHSAREYVDRKITPHGPGVPLILVPTTSGTGSEVSIYFVVTVGEEKRFIGDPYYLANMVIIDPLLTADMPPGITASTGIDALTHAVEGILNKNANPLGDALGLGGIGMISSYLRRAVADGEDLEARYHMSMAASMAMMELNMTAGLYAHSVSYVIPAYKPVPHGVGCGLGLPYLMDYVLPVRSAKLRKIAAAMGEQTWIHSELDASKLAVKSVARLIRDVGLPVTLQELGGIEESLLEKMADQMITKFPRPLNPRPMGKEESIQFWRDMWDGKL